MTETHRRTAEQWTQRLEYRLAGEPGMDRAAITEVLDEVAAHCAETGRHPEEAFGTPDEFAARAARDRVPVEERARRDRSFRAPSEFWPAGLVTVTGLLAVFTVFALVHHGLWFDVTVSGLCGVALMAVVVQLGWFGLGLHADGRIRAAALAVGGAAALVVASALAFLALPDDRIARFPTLALIPVCVALHALTVRLGRGRHSRATAPAGPGDPTDPDQWLRRLEALLRGRHKLPGRRAAELTAEARNHLAASGSSPAEEFGPVEVYALGLAEHAGPRTWWSRSDWQLPVLCALVTASWVVRLYQGDIDRVFWVNTAGVVAVALLWVAKVMPDKPSS
ncbi:hypothetical protein ACIQ7D_15685 [Streptomyces sp. NPDC096310]|uniref:hypothetical protein n=1 Tax=Streptomyces sp. NPDC096310 TaxID=3366082 RepID=UPI003824486C